MPMMAREAMSWFIDWLKPAAIEPIMKIAKPRMKNSLRPNRSANLPAMGIAMVEGDQVCGRSPGVAVEPAQVGQDARHCGGDIDLAHCRQKHGRHHAGQRRQELFPGESQRASHVR